MKYRLRFHTLISSSLFLTLALLMFNNQLSAQCGGGGTLVSNLTMLPTFQTINVSAGQRYTFTAYTQTTYYFSFCQGGGSTSIDTQLEICNQAGTVVYAYNDDFCGLGSEIIWIAPANGTYSVVIHQHYCQNNGTPAGLLAYMTITPPNAQDCLGAIPLCFNTYYTNNSYSGTGHYPNEIPTTGGCPGNCMLAGERNDVWYTFTTQTAGTVSFVITPNNSSDDYDWAVYNLTNHDCSIIATNPSAVQVSCNWTATTGPTGPNGGTTSTCTGSSGSPFNAALTVTAGQTYVVNVSNYSSTQSGYTITFGGTSQILDNTSPELVQIVHAPVCGSSALTLQFSEQIWCLGTDPSDFVVTGPLGEYSISNVWAPVCVAGLGSSYGDTYYDDLWTLEFSDYLQHDGDYTVEIIPSSITDICGNFANPSITLSFHINGVQATSSVIHGTTCYGGSDGSATINSISGGTPPYTISWPSGETTQTAVNLDGGTIFVTVTDSTGICHNVMELDIPQPPPIIVEAGTDQTICPGQSVPIGGSPTIINGVAPLTYGWSPATGLSDPNNLNPTATPMATTTYILTVQDNTGCTAADAVVITVHPAATVNLGPDAQVCVSSLPLNLNAGAGFTNYIWSNPAYNGQPSMPVSASGTYSVTVTNSNGCTATDQITVTVVDNPVVNLGANQVVCSYNLPHVLDAGAGYSVYDWNVDAYDGSQTMPVTASGVYSVTVSDAYGCSGSGQISITVDPAINLSLATVAPLCNGTATGTISAIASGGTPPLSYLWSNGQTASVINGLVADVVYSVTVSDAAGCSLTASATLTDPPVLQADIATNPTECGEAIGSASVTAIGGVGGYTYLWSTGENTDNISGLHPGVHYCTVTDANGCSVVASETVGAYGEGTVTLSLLQGVMCYGNTTGVLQAAMTDGFPPFQYQWSGSPQNGPVLNNLPAGNYSVTVTDVYGCPGYASYSINQPEAIVVSEIIEDVLCRGGSDGSITLNVTGGVSPYIYNWSNGATSSHISSLTAGAYSVVITDLNNCTYQGFYNILQPEKALDLLLLTQDVICYKDNNGAALATGDGGTPPYTIVWYKQGVIIGNGSELTSLPAGSYQVVLIDANNCQANNYFAIDQPAEIVITTTISAASCRGNDDGEVVVDVYGGVPPYDYEWNTGDLIANLEGAHSGQYSVSVTDANNCTKTLNVYIPESSKLCLRIPNAFTPNGDGVNDTWIIEFIEKYPLAEVYVFNRWGQKLYDKKNNTGHWDGYYEGKLVPTGSYTYIVDLRNGMEPFTGVVVVVH